VQGGVLAGKGTYLLGELVADPANVGPLPHKGVSTVQPLDHVCITRRCMPTKTMVCRPFWQFVEHYVLKAICTMLPVRISLLLVLSCCRAILAVAMHPVPPLLLPQLEIADKPICQKARAKGDYTVKNIIDCKAAIEMLPWGHDVHFKDMLHLHPSRPQRPRISRPFIRRPPPQGFLTRERHFLLPATFRAGSCLLLVYPRDLYFGINEGSGPTWISNPDAREWMNIWVQVRQAAFHILSQCDPTKPNENLGSVLKKVTLGMNKDFELRVGITGVPTGLPHQWRFPDEEGWQVSLEPPFTMGPMKRLSFLYGEGGTWEGDYTDDFYMWDFELGEGTGQWWPQFAR